MNIQPHTRYIDLTPYFNRLCLDIYRQRCCTANCVLPSELDTGTNTTNKVWARTMFIMVLLEKCKFTQKEVAIECNLERSSVSYAKRRHTEFMEFDAEYRSRWEWLQGMI